MPVMVVPCTGWKETVSDQDTPTYGYAFQTFSHQSLTSVPLRKHRINLIANTVNKSDAVFPIALQPVLGVGDVDNL